MVVLARRGAAGGNSWVSVQGLAFAVGGPGALSDPPTVRALVGTVGASTERQVGAGTLRQWL